MSEAIASLIARQRTAELARGALPDRPVRPDPATDRPRGAVGGIRRTAGDALRRLADRLEPSPAGCLDSAADGR